MSLCRAIELIGFLQRGRKAHPSEPESWQSAEVTQVDQDRQFAFLQSTLGGASTLPPELKDAIHWAEDIRKKHGMN